MNLNLVMGKLGHDQRPWPKSHEFEDKIR